MKKGQWCGSKNRGREHHPVRHSTESDFGQFWSTSKAIDNSKLLPLSQKYLKLDVAITTNQVS